MDLFCFREILKISSETNEHNQNRLAMTWTKMAKTNLIENIAGRG